MMNARTAVAAAANHQTGTDDDFKLDLLLALESISGLRLSSLTGNSLGNIASYNHVRQTYFGTG